MDIIKLKEICTIISGNKPNKNLASFLSNNPNYGLPFPKHTDVLNNILNSTKLFFSKNHYNLTKVEKGEGLYFFPDCDPKPFISMISFCMDTHIWKLVLDNKKIYEKYFFYWLIKNKTYIKKLMVGSVLKYITKNLFLNLSINLPNLEIQKQIINIIEPFEKKWIFINSKIKKIVNIGDILISNNDEKLIKIKELANINIGSTPSTKNNDFWIGKNFWINSGNLTNNICILNSDKFLSEFAVQSKNLKIAAPMSTFFSILEPDKNKISICGFQTYYNQSIANITPKNSSFNGYIFFEIRRNIKKIKLLQSGTAQQSVNKQKILNFFIRSLNNNEYKMIFNHLCFLILMYSKKINIIKNILKNLIDLLFI